MAEALIIVDFQNDFTPPSGALAVPGGDEIAPRLNELARSGDFDLVVATRDWHPSDHGSFAEQGGPWPVHCVADTPGAQLHPALDTSAIDVIVDKGTDPATEGYSGFEGTGLETLLRERGIDRVTVVGLATDYCVRATALDALREGFDVEIDRAGVRGIDAQPGDADRALAEVEALAPEHLVLLGTEAEALAPRIRRAGAVFVGRWSAVAAGDYATGGNHVLPTGGWARAVGGLGLETFLKPVTVQRLTRDGLTRLRPVVEALAAVEGMPAHAEAVRR